MAFLPSCSSGICGDLAESLRKVCEACGYPACTQELECKYPDGLPLLDPVEDIGIQDPSLTAAVHKIAALEQRLADNAVHKSAAGSAARYASSLHSLP